MCSQKSSLMLMRGSPGWYLQAQTAFTICKQKVIVLRWGELRA